MVSPASHCIVIVVSSAPALLSQHQRSVTLTICSHRVLLVGLFATQEFACTCAADRIKSRVFDKPSTQCFC